MSPKLTAPPTVVPLAALLHPSSLVLLVTNLVPLVGVLRWGWDAFLLLMLYWMESAIIAFWTIARIATLPPGAMGRLYVNGRPTNSRAAMTGFFVVFLGAFMAVHLLFLWGLFSGDWGRRIHGLRDFYAQILVASGLWGPLLLLFASRGFSFLFHALNPDIILAIERFIPVPGLPRPPDSSAADAKRIVSSVLGRIALMQIAIIFGGMLAVAFGSHAPLFILIILKTIIDLSLHAAVDMRHRLRISAAPGVS